MLQGVLRAVRSAARKNKQDDQKNESRKTRRSESGRSSMEFDNEGRKRSNQERNKTKLNAVKDFRAHTRRISGLDPSEAFAQRLIYQVELDSIRESSFVKSAKSAGKKFENVGDDMKSSLKSYFLSLIQPPSSINQRFIHFVRRNIRSVACICAFILTLIEYWIAIRVHANAENIPLFHWQAQNLHSEAGFYYSFYENFSRAGSWSEAISTFTKDTQSEAPDTINALTRFNILPELLLGCLARIAFYYILPFILHVMCSFHNGVSFFQMFLGSWISPFTAEESSTINNALGDQISTTSVNNSDSLIPQLLTSMNVIDSESQANNFCNVWIEYAGSAHSTGWRPDLLLDPSSFLWQFYCFTICIWMAVGSVALVAIGFELTGWEEVLYCFEKSNAKNGEASSSSQQKSIAKNRRSKFAAFVLRYDSIYAFGMAILMIIGLYISRSQLSRILVDSALNMREHFGLPFLTLQIFYLIRSLKNFRLQENAQTLLPEGSLTRIVQIHSKTPYRLCFWRTKFFTSSHAPLSDSFGNMFGLFITTIASLVVWQFMPFLLLLQAIALFLVFLLNGITAKSFARLLDVFCISFGISAVTLGGMEMMLGSPYLCILFALRVTVTIRFRSSLFAWMTNTLATSEKGKDDISCNTDQQQEREPLSVQNKDIVREEVEQKKPKETTEALQGGKTVEAAAHSTTPTKSVEKSPEPEWSIVDDAKIVNAQPPHLATKKQQRTQSIRASPEKKKMDTMTPFTQYNKCKEQDMKKDRKNDNAAPSMIKSFSCILPIRHIGVFLFQSITTIVLFFMLRSVISRDADQHIKEIFCGRLQRSYITDWMKENGLPSFHSYFCRTSYRTTFNARLYLTMEIFNGISDDAINFLWDCRLVHFSVFSLCAFAIIVILHLNSFIRQSFSSHNTKAVELNNLASSNILDPISNVQDILHARSVVRLNITTSEDFWVWFFFVIQFLFFVVLGCFIGRLRMVFGPHLVLIAAFGSFPLWKSSSSFLKRKRYHFSVILREEKTGAPSMVEVYDNQQPTSATTQHENGITHDSDSTHDHGSSNHGSDRGSTSLESRGFLQKSIPNIIHIVAIFVTGVGFVSQLYSHLTLLPCGPSKSLTAATLCGRYEGKQIVGAKDVLEVASFINRKLIKKQSRRSQVRQEMVTSSRDHVKISWATTSMTTMKIHQDQDHVGFQKTNNNTRSFNDYNNNDPTNIIPVISSYAMFQDGGKRFKNFLAKYVDIIHKVREERKNFDKKNSKKSKFSQHSPKQNDKKSSSKQHIPRPPDISPLSGSGSLYDINTSTILAASMSISGTLRRFSSVGLVVHPHFESKKLRDRVQHLFAGLFHCMKPKDFALSILKRLQARFVLIELRRCLHTPFKIDKHITENLPGKWKDGTNCINSSSELMCRSILRAPKWFRLRYANSGFVFFNIIRRG